MEATQKDPVAALREHVLTEARNRRNDVVAIEGDRGGVEFKTLSYLDVLLEGEIITPSQFNLGNIFWTLRDTLFHFLQTKTGRYDYTPEDEGSLLEDVTHEGAEEGMATELYLAIRRKLDGEYTEAISAACQTIPSAYLPQRMAIIHAFGAGMLSLSFAELERIYQSAKDDAKKRIEEAKNNACHV